jgi:hypothetical protein
MGPYRGEENIVRGETTGRGARWSEVGPQEGGENMVRGGTTGGGGTMLEAGPMGEGRIWLGMGLQ